MSQLPMRLLFLVVAGFIFVGNCAAGEWKEISAELLAKEKPGYGGLTGVVAHPVTGDVYAFVSDRGLFKSTDRGETWTLHIESLKGRTEWPGSIVLLPSDQDRPEKFRLDDRFVIALVYGDPIVTNLDGREKWTKMHAKASHVDWTAFSAEGFNATFVLALKHESGDVLLRSTDGGKSFDELGKDFGPACVFDENTAVVLRGPQGKRRPLRTTDAGKTFTECGDWNTRALAVGYGSKVYWLTDVGIMATKDKGATWAKHCDAKEGRFGPVFGKDEKHMFVLTNRGVIESRDSGSTWSEPIAYPKGIQANSPLTWLAYDAKGNVLYLAQMGAPLFRMVRGE